MNQQYNFSSVSGRIQYLLMDFNTTDTELQVARMVALKNLMPGVKFLLWCNQPSIADAVSLYLADRNIPHTVNKYDDPLIPDDHDCMIVYENISGVNPWIRDAFFASKRQENTCMLLDTVDEDASDQGWAKRLTRMNLAAGPQLAILGNSDENPENLGIAGGDLLTDGRFVFLGKQAPLLEALLANTTDPDATVVVLDEKKAYPALYHLDLFLSLTGIEVEGRYVVLLGRCKALEPAFEARAGQYNECLGRIAGRLEEQYPVKVIRNPIPVDENLYPYNNCIVEVYGQEKRVWMSKFSHDFPQNQCLIALEQENKATWESLGFTVYLVDASCKDLLGNKAGLHCITNELRF